MWLTTVMLGGAESAQLAAIVPTVAVIAAMLSAEDRRTFRRAQTSGPAAHGSSMPLATLRITGD